MLPEKSKRLSVCIHAFVLMVILPTMITSAEEPAPTTYVELLNQMQIRDVYLGKRYTYHFSFSKLPEGLIAEDCYPAMLSGTRVLEIGVPLEGSTIVPMRLTQTIEAPSEPGAVDGKLVNFWEASDGKETRRFCRFVVGDKCQATPEHLGFVLAGPSPETNGLDPLFTALNAGGSALHGIVGSPPRLFEEEEFQGKELSLATRDDPQFGKTFVTGMDGRYGLVLSGPEFLVLGWSETPSPDSFNLYVDELVVYDGIRYPKSGRTESPSKSGTFELLNVEEFDQAPGGNVQWFPEWPSGTVVLDYTSGVTTRIPFDAHEMAEIKRRLRENCDEGLLPVATSPANWFLWINGLLLLGLVAFGVKWWRNRSQATWGRP